MDVSVIGLGYIGLPTAAVLASNEINVIGVDINQDIIDDVNNGKSHIAEPGISDLIKTAIKNNNLVATKEVRKSDVFIIAVPTPFTNEKKADLSYIYSAVESIAPFLEKGNMIIIESTIPVGTTEQILTLLSQVRKDLSFPKFKKENENTDIYLAHCPERVLPGKIVRELVNNDRIIGGISQSCAREAERFYKIFINSKCLLTDSRTAELSKLVENSYRDVNIAFANELSLICDKLEINVFDLIEIANHHPRVEILQPGPGVGGHCIAVDPWFIIDSAPNQTQLMAVARKVNDEKPEYVLSKVKELVKNNHKDYQNLNIACFGLAFKADIDDLRESPALEIAISIESIGFKSLNIVEPNISDLPFVFTRETTNLVTIQEAIERSDLLLLLVDHSEFKDIKTSLLEHKMILDTKGIWRK